MVSPSTIKERRSRESKIRRSARLRQLFAFTGPRWLVDPLSASLESTLESNGAKEAEDDDFRDAFLFDLLLRITDSDDLDDEVVGAFAPAVIADQLNFKLTPVNGIEQTDEVRALRAALSAFVVAGER